MVVPSILENPSIPREKLGAWTVEAIGAAMGLAAVGLVLVNPEPLTVWLFELGLAIVVPAFIVYGGYRLGTSDLHPADQRRVATWTVVGVYFAGLFGVLMVLHQRLEGGAIIEPGYFLLVVMASGALVGLLSSVGTNATRLSRPSTPTDAFSSVTEGVDGTAQPEIPLDDELTRRWLSGTVIEDADYQRLLVLQFMRRHPYSVFTVDDLVDDLLDDVDDTDPLRVALHRKHLHLQLRHVHLPKLADAGLVSYQPPLVEYEPADEHAS